jgi:hypothetical protein
MCGSKGFIPTIDEQTLTMTMERLCKGRIETVCSIGYFFWIYCRVGAKYNVLFRILSPRCKIRCPFWNIIAQVQSTMPYFHLTELLALHISSIVYCILFVSNVFRRRSCVVCWVSVRYHELKYVLVVTLCSFTVSDCLYPLPPQTLYFFPRDTFFLPRL